MDVVVIVEDFVNVTACVVVLELLAWLPLCGGVDFVFCDRVGGVPVVLSVWPTTLAIRSKSSVPVWGLDLTSVSKRSLWS